MKIRHLILIGLVLSVMVAALPAAAQVRDVTDDEVNDIAEKLYCPVCENITLDTCGTAACEDWRSEIRLKLEDGWTEQQIVDDFVARFGDRVVGTPVDPTLRALSLVTPWIIIALSFAGIAVVFFRWRSGRMSSLSTPVSANGVNTADLSGDYQSRLERDLEG